MAPLVRSRGDSRTRTRSPVRIRTKLRRGSADRCAVTVPWAAPGFPSGRLPGPPSASRTR